MTTPITAFGLGPGSTFEAVGEGRVTVPAGTFEAWKVQVGNQSGFDSWVSKDRQWLLRWARQLARRLAPGTAGDEE